MCCPSHQGRAKADLTGLGHTNARREATMMKACARRRPTTVGVMDPRWRSRQGYRTTSLLKTMDGAAGGAMMHGLVGRIGALTLGRRIGAIALGGRSGVPAMGGRTGPVARPMGGVGLRDEYKHTKHG